MALDIVDFQGFYASPLGEFAQRSIARIVRRQWASCAGLSIAGFGYATPYLDPLRADSIRALAFMPAKQGVVNWPSTGRSSSALIDMTMIPLPAASIDRVLIAHALEFSETPQETLAEIWRILTPGGRLIVIAPSRSGLWARVDTTPFGHGQPYSRSQLRELLRESLFSPVQWGEALYAPPFAKRMLLKMAPAIERIGARFSLPGAGIHLVEATKQLYRPVGLQRPAYRPVPQLAEPVLVPAAGRVRAD